MTPARKSKWGTFLIHQYAHHLYKKNFFSITFGGEGLTYLQSNFSSAILYGNHHYWWDGLLEISLMRRFALDSYLMMEEKNLQQFAFFRRAGVYGVNLQDKQSGASALRYTTKLLRDPHAQRRAVFLFPQGSIRPPYAPDLPYQGGLHKLLELAKDTPAIPIYKEIVPWKFPHPLVHIEVGAPLYKKDLVHTTDLPTAVNRLREKTRERFALGKWQDAELYFLNQKDLTRVPESADFPPELLQRYS